MIAVKEEELTQDIIKIIGGGREGGRKRGWSKEKKYMRKFSFSKKTID